MKIMFSTWPALPADVRVETVADARRTAGLADAIDPADAAPDAVAAMGQRAMVDRRPVVDVVRREIADLPHRRDVVELLATELAPACPQPHHTEHRQRTITMASTRPSRPLPAASEARWSQPGAHPGADVDALRTGRTDRPHRDLDHAPRPFGGFGAPWAA